MTTITLPSDVFLEVIKFVPYENAINLVLTRKNWVKPLQVQLNEQRIAILATIQRLEGNGLEGKQRKIKSDWDRLVRNEEELCRSFYVNRCKSISEQTAAIALFNQRLQAIQADRNAAYDQYCAIARKRQPIIEKLESLESKLNQCEKPETERFADLNCYFVITFGIAFLAFIADMNAKYVEYCANMLKRQPTKVRVLNQNWTNAENRKLNVLLTYATFTQAWAAGLGSLYYSLHRL